MTEPLVSIGLPVYNGERYVAHAIQSILDQTYTNFELIISDNASTDNTAGICKNFAMADKRITYIRNPDNLGAGPNYDNCFLRSSGTYFKWISHDDMVQPRFLEKSVNRLEENPESVLCYSQVCRIDENNNQTGIFNPVYAGIESERVEERFKAMITGLTTCEIFFGLIRKSALENSELHGNYISSDKVLLTELAMRGPFARINEPLLMDREHDQRYTRAVYPDRYRSFLWFDSNNKNRNPYRRITLYQKYLQIIGKNISGMQQRLACYLCLIRYMAKARNIRLLAHDLVMAISPRLYRKIDIISEGDRRIR